MISDEALETIRTYFRPFHDGKSFLLQYYPLQDQYHSLHGDQVIMAKINGAFSELKRTGEYKKISDIAFKDAMQEKEEESHAPIRCVDKPVIQMNDLERPEGHKNDLKPVAEEDKKLLCKKAINENDYVEEKILCEQLRCPPCDPNVRICSEFECGKTKAKEEDKLSAPPMDTVEKMVSEAKKFENVDKEKSERGPDYPPPARSSE
uniref:Uncharacterized protein n=1 Tax=Panagrolaimus sp. ES5 TaxID=591445 RepID=A0AC34F8T9_9BILA